MGIVVTALIVIGAGAASWWAALKGRTVGDRMRLGVVAATDLQPDAELSGNDVEVGLFVVPSTERARYVPRPGDVAGRRLSDGIGRGVRLEFRHLGKREEEEQESGDVDELGKRLTEKLERHDWEHTIALARIEHRMDQIAELLARAETLARPEAGPERRTRSNHQDRIDLEREDGRIDLVQLFDDLLVTLEVDQTPEARTDSIAAAAVHAFLGAVAEAAGENASEAVLAAILEPPPRMVPRPAGATATAVIAGFRPNDPTPPSDAVETLRPIVEMARRHVACEMEVLGYADTTGDPGRNLTLSEERARQSRAS